MSRDLYETLGVAKEATPEQIRKAYKKRALETHPDRHPNATPSEKAQIEESFREISNAYEVLNSPESRQLYDMHGVWPPPSPDAEPSRRHHPRSHSSRHRRHDSFDDPFFKGPFMNDPFIHRPFQSFSFTDPFDLFERMFPRQIFDEPIYPQHHSHHHHRSRDPFRQEDPFALSRHLHNDLNNFMSSMQRNMLMGFGDVHTLPARHASVDGQANYARQVHITKTVNGVTQTIQKTRDWDGNERVIKTYPDGRRVVTVNGVEQREQSYLPSSSRNPPDPRGIPPPPSTGHYGNDHLPPPPPYTPDAPVIPPSHMYDPYQPAPNMPDTHDHSSSKKKRWGFF
ncbi:hypothetical protein VNI00_002806 [Paramarasmius palmivorus]|uniref:J domain-containing protein n=1 Tax=Paramarasmius palmivorus TaxID=297713 RepID=A0AAW0DU09_9AGAR